MTESEYSTISVNLNEKYVDSILAIDLKARIINLTADIRHCTKI